MNKPTTAIENVSDVREVAALQRVRHEIDAWKERHGKAYSELAALVDRHNILLAAAGKVVRERAISCGPFELYEQRPKYDAEAFYAAVGRQRFAALGGVLATTEDRSIDPVRFAALIAEGKIGQELVAKVVTYEPRYHAPKPILLP